VCSVGCWQSGDCEGGEEAVGEGKAASEEGGGIIWSATIPVTPNDWDQFSSTKLKGA
jgi:hypothetical protein